MINRTIAFMAVWGLVGAVAGPVLHSFFGLSVLISFSFVWSGTTVIVLLRSIFVTQHRQLAVLRELSRLHRHAAASAGASANRAAKAQKSMLQKLALLSRQYHQLEPSVSRNFGDQARMLYDVNRSVVNLSNRILAVELNQEQLEDELLEARGGRPTLSSATGNYEAHQK